MERKRVPLKLSPARGAVLVAPLAATDIHQKTNLVCGLCEVVLLREEVGHVHNLLIPCTQCGSYNTTDI